MISLQQSESLVCIFLVFVYVDLITNWDCRVLGASDFCLLYWKLFIVSKYENLNSGETEDKVYETLSCEHFRETLCIIVVNSHFLCIYLLLYHCQELLGRTVLCSLSGD